VGPRNHELVGVEIPTRGQFLGSLGPSKIIVSHKCIVCSNKAVVFPCHRLTVLSCVDADNLPVFFLFVCDAGSLVSDGDPAMQFNIEKTCGSGYGWWFFSTLGFVISCIISLHCMHSVHKMRARYYWRRSVVCVSVCLLVTFVNPVKTTERSRCCLGGLTQMGPRNHVL